MAISDILGNLESVGIIITSFIKLLWWIFLWLKNWFELIVHGISF